MEVPQHLQASCAVVSSFLRQPGCAVWFSVYSYSRTLSPINSGGDRGGQMWGIQTVCSLMGKYWSQDGLEF